MLYDVRFYQVFEYEIEAEDEEEAFNKAHKEFIAEMCRPIANTNYDDYEIEEVEAL